MKAQVAWARGKITAESYPVLQVETGRKSLGRDKITLSLSCDAYEEDRDACVRELEQIAEAINCFQTVEEAIAEIMDID